VINARWPARPDGAADDAGERCAQDGALELGTRHVDARLAHLLLVTGCVAGRRPGICLAHRPLGLPFGHQILPAQLADSNGIFRRDTRRDTRLARAAARRHCLALCLGHLGALIVVPQFKENVALLDAIALRERQPGDLAAHWWRKPRPVAGIHGASAGIGDSSQHGATLNFRNSDRHRLRPTREPDHQGNQGNQTQQPEYSSTATAHWLASLHWQGIGVAEV
jgi:hypothetical protein